VGASPFPVGCKGIVRTNRMVCGILSMHRQDDRCRGIRTMILTSQRYTAWRHDMAKRGLPTNTCIVHRTFDADQLPPHLECFTMIGRHTVLIESSENPPVFAFLNRDTHQINCHCLQAELWGTCNHQRALAAGLWAHLAALPQTQSLVTCTRAWCAYGTCYAPVVPAQATSAHLTER
jgi:hypothetical protein